MKSKARGLFVTSWLSVLFLILSSVVNASTTSFADMRMKVSADIPDFIQLRGLPKRATLKETTDGIVQTEIMTFYVERSGASINKEKPFLLTIKSNHGQEGEKYYLKHENGQDKLAIYAGLHSGNTRSVNDLETVPDSGLRSMTWASPDSKLATHSLAFFNKDTQYMNTHPSGYYSANFTIMVQAQ